MKVTVFGTGYVGLVTGICLAEIGHEVICVDTNVDKIAMLKSGKSPIYESGLDELLVKNLDAKRVVFTTDAISGIKHAEYLFIAVGTPSVSDGSADLQYVYEVAKTIGQNLDHFTIIVNKSTVPIGVGSKVKSIVKKELDKRRLDIDFCVVSNPEFLKQGDAIKDFMHSDRIIIGAETSEAFERMHLLYKPLKETKIISMDVRSAELSKYAANAFLASKISFINEIAQFAERFGADVENIRVGIGADPRIGSDFLYAGCGYGGSCLPKDVSALIWMAREHGIETPLFNAVENINLRQKNLIFNRLKRYFGDLEDRVIALWGLSFKPNTEDMRDAPSKVLLESLWRAGAKVQAYDPIAMPEAMKIYGSRADFTLCKTSEDALEKADVLVIVTEWDEFRHPNIGLIKNKLINPIIFDGRNLLDPEDMYILGIDYHAIGRRRNWSLGV